MRSAGICFNHQPPGYCHSTTAMMTAETASGWQAAPINRASGPVRAGQPSRPRSRSLLCAFVFKGQLFSCRRHPRTRSQPWCSSCLMMSRCFQDCASSVLAASARCLALMSLRRPFNASSMMRKSCQTRLVCQSLLKGSIQNTSSIRSRRLFN